MFYAWLQESPVTFTLHLNATHRPDILIISVDLFQNLIMQDKDIGHTTYMHDLKVSFVTFILKLPHW